MPRHNGSHLLDLPGWYFGGVKSAAVLSDNSDAPASNAANACTALELAERLAADALALALPARKAGYE